MPKVVDHGERRQLIVDGMWAIVQRDGFSAVSVRSIATEVCLSKSTIAHYFSSQDEILAVAVQQQIDMNNQEFAALDLQRCTPGLAQQAMLVAIPTTTQQRRQSQVWLALLEHSAASPLVADALAQMNREIRATVRVLLSALDANGFVAPERDLDLEAVKFHAAIDGLSVQSLTDQQSAEPSLVREVLAAMIADLAHPNS